MKTELDSTAVDTFAAVVARLNDAGIPTATGDAEIILAHALGLRRADVQSGALDGVILTDRQRNDIRDFMNRRVDREPLQHLTGRAFFRQLELSVGRGVFVPRRETEFVTQLAIDALRASDAEHPIAVDLGTGAGAIALSMAVEVPAATVYGVEISPEAFEWTSRNFAEHAPVNGHPILGDMTDALGELDGQVDVVSGNPPFLPDGIEPVTPEVRLFDPAVSWAAGGDGLLIIRALSKTALRLLKPGGRLAFEHGISQGPRVGELLEADGWSSITNHQDPRGEFRVTTARR
ncbi:release factor glutamine methyltransferase [Salinibacterium sp. CAN_S4]|uniref:N5-glutamine methyltransferase family protein n=1 Tax=Salinibacterium sp. CAN_S4 TaxID=2787727 RepID=UPI0018EFFCD7